MAVGMLLEELKSLLGFPQSRWLSAEAQDHPGSLLA